MLIVVTGQNEGRTHALSANGNLLGRGADVDVDLADGTVSRRPATVTVQGTDVVFQDLGSANGSWVNNERVRGPVRLGDGDLVRVGNVELEFVGAAHPQRTGGSQSYGFGDVRGPVNAGSGNLNAGSGTQHIGDTHIGDNLDIDTDYDPWDEIFSGRGPGRFIMAVGGIVALSGFGLWMMLIFSAGGSPKAPDPFEQKWLGLPAAAVTFGLFLGGGVLASIGGADGTRRPKARGTSTTTAEVAKGMSSSFKFGDVSGPVNAGTGNLNVGSGQPLVGSGAQSVASGAGSTVAADPTAAAAIEALRREVSALRLSAPEHATATRQIDELEHAPDKATAATVLAQLTRGLKEAGALSNAAGNIIDAVKGLAKWIGPAAGVVLAILGT